MSFSDGIFEGEWVNDKINGYGYYKFKDNPFKYDYYEGEWVNDLFEGFGISKSLEDDVFEGMWK